MSSKNYDIDDILLEAQRLKKQAGTTKSSPLKTQRETVETELEYAENLADEIEYETSRIQKIKVEQYGEMEPKEPKQNTHRPHSAQESFTPLSDEEVRTPTTFADLKKKAQFSAKTGQGERKKSPRSPLTQHVDYEEEFATNTSIPPIDSRVGKAKPHKNSNEKVDLFNFQPEVREKPIRTGPYGQKRFDFQKPSTKPKEAPAPSNEELEDTDSFDFDSISEKIDQLQNEDPPVATGSSKFAFGFEQTEEIKLNSGKKEHRTIGRFAFGKETSPSTEIEEEEPSINSSKKRSSIFSTFAAGTGQELKIEDIKKINFSDVDGAGGGYYEEDDYFQDEYPDGSTLGFHLEYGPETDRQDVARDIANTKMGIFISSAITAILTGILFYFALSAKYPKLPMLYFLQPEKTTLKPYLISCIAITALVGLVSIKTMISGITGLFRMRANSDTLVSFALLGAILQGIMAIRHIELLDMTQLNLYYPVAALAMLFNCIGKMGMLGRIQQNFKITAAKQEKRSVLAVESASFCRDILPEETGRRPTIAYTAKSDFFSDFLALSFSNKYDVGINRSVAPVCILGALIVGLMTHFLTSNPVETPLMAVSAFAAILCICATFSTTFIENIPLGKLAKVLTPMGAMVSGNKAVESFCDTSAVVLTENDLFPAGHVYLNGIKAFPNGRIDDAILDAASVLCALNGSLSAVFLDMIGGDKQLLKKMDNVVFENGMGLSGWVDGRRVLIGNRMLMQNHGVELPQDSYERAHPRDTPGNPIYLSNTGEVSARFLVEYMIDEELAYQLDLLATKGKQLIVYTTDANITAGKIWELYGYPLELITVMPSELQDDFREMSVPRKETPAEIVYTGRPATFIAAILGTINARASILSATVVQLIQVVLGYGLITLMSFMGYLGSFSMTKMIFYQLFWFVAILIIQQTRRP